MANPRRIAIALQIDEPYPQHQEVLAGVQQFAHEHGGWQCLIDEHPMVDASRRGPSYQVYDGVVARADSVMQRRLARHGIPLVNVHYQSAKQGLPGVYPDAQSQGIAAADHLMERGFKSLCYIGDLQNHRHSAEICRSFSKRVVEEGGKCTAYDIPDAFFKDAKPWLLIERLLTGWVAELSPPMGVCVEEAPVARMLIQRCQQEGWRVPGDVAVLCQHNLKAVVEVSPQISSIEIDNVSIGYAAARLLDQMIEGEAYSGNPVLIAPKNIIARESTDYFAVEDEMVAEALQYIGARLAEPLRVEDVAYALSVSTRLLQARFSAALGRGVSEEVRRLRLLLAKRLLGQEDL